VGAVLVADLYRQIMNKAYYDKNREAILTRKKIYNFNNKEKIKAKREDRKEEAKKYHRVYYFENRKHVLATQKIYRDKKKKKKLLINIKPINEILRMATI